MSRKRSWRSLQLTVDTFRFPDATQVRGTGRPDVWPCFRRIRPKRVCHRAKSFPSVRSLPNASQNIPYNISEPSALVGVYIGSLGRVELRRPNRVAYGWCGSTVRTLRIITTLPRLIVKHIACRTNSAFNKKQFERHCCHTISYIEFLAARCHSMDGRPWALSGYYPTHER